MEGLNLKRINNAITNIFSAIVQVNITYDKYAMLWSDNTVVDVDAEGSFVELIEVFLQSVHPDDVKVLLEHYSMWNLLNFLERNQILECYEVRQYREDGNYHWVEISIIQFKEEKKGEKDILIIAKNIDSKKENEKQLEEKVKEMEDARQYRSGLISRVSHDIRTPMNVIIGMANIARNSEGDSGKINSCLDKMLSASEYVMSLANKILETAKAAYNSEERVEDDFTLDQLIEDITNISTAQIEKKSIDFQVCVGKLTSRKFIGDRVLLNRVLINLISNSTKFVDVGGQIILSVEERSADDEKIEMCFTVKDNGIGMSEEFLKKVFQPFEQEKNENEHETTTYGGTGLGLSICRVLVEKIGGKISVESEKEKGSQFIIVIPLRIQKNDNSSGDRLESLEISSASEQDYLGKRILIVEDNELNVEIMLAILEEKNLEIELARNGQEAVDLFEKSSEGYYDLIMMDIMMPIKNGIEATCEIRSLNRKDSKEIPIIAMTADGYNNHISGILEGKSNDSVLKPINTEQLYSTLHIWLKTL